MPDWLTPVWESFYYSVYCFEDRHTTHFGASTKAEWRRLLWISIFVSQLNAEKKKILGVCLKFSVCAVVFDVISSECFGEAAANGLFGNDPTAFD